MFSIISKGCLSVASVTDDVPSDWNKVDCRGLIDGSGNPASEVDKLKSITLDSISRGLKICCVCDYGQSRSNLIAALALSELKLVSLKDAIRLVSEAHPQSCIKPSLLSDVMYCNRQPGDGKCFAVTGVSGLLGRSLTSLFYEKSKFPVVGLSRSSHGDYLLNKSILSATIKEGGVTDLIHLAYPRPHNSYQSYLEAMRHLVNIANACVENSCVLHYVSGWTIFDASSEDFVVESTLPNSHSIYGQSKILQEKFLLFQAASHCLNLKIYRLPGVYSLDCLEPRFLRYIADCAINGFEMVYHLFENGSAVVPLTSLDSAVESLYRAIVLTTNESDVIHLSRGVYNVRIQDLARAVAREYGFNVRPSMINRRVFAGKFTTSSSFVGDVTRVTTIDDILDFIKVIIKSGNPFKID